MPVLTRVDWFSGATRRCATHAQTSEYTATKIISKPRSVARCHRHKSTSFRVMSGSRTSATPDTRSEHQPSSTTNNDDRLSPTPNSSLILHPSTQSSGFFTRWRHAFLGVGFAILLTPLTFFLPGESPVDPTDYAERTRRVLRDTPLIDGHNDLPWQLRIELHNRIYNNGLDLEKRLLGHTDIVRMRQGQVGGQFWSVYVDCDVKQQHFEDPSVCAPESVLGLRCARANRVRAP